MCLKDSEGTISEWLESYKVWQKCQKVLFKRGGERSHPCHMQKGQEIHCKAAKYRIFKRGPPDKFMTCSGSTLSTCDKQCSVSCFSVVMFSFRKHRVQPLAFSPKNPTSESTAQVLDSSSPRITVRKWDTWACWVLNVTIAHESFIEAFYSTVMMFCACLRFSKTASDVGETYWCPFPQ